MTAPQARLFEVYVIFDDEFEARELLGAVEQTGIGHGIRAVELGHELEDGETRRSIG